MNAEGLRVSARAHGLPHWAQALVWVLASLLLVALLVLLDVLHQASGNASQQGVSDPVKLGPVSVLFLDEGAPQRTPEQMLEQGDWKPVQLPLALGWHTDRLWARVEVNNTSPEAQPVWFEVSPPRLTRVWMHAVGPSGLWESHASGASVAGTERPLNMANLVFPLTLAAGAQRTVLVEVSSPATSLNVGFAVVPAAAYPGLAARTGLLDAAFIGGLLVLGLISLILGMLQRERTLLLLAARSMAICVWQMQQLGMWALLLPSTAVALLASSTAMMASSVVVLTVAFTWSFLSHARLSRWVHGVFATVLALAVVLAVLRVAGLMDITRFSVLGIYLSGGMQLFTCLLSTVLIFKGHLLAVPMFMGSAFTLVANGPLYLLAAGWAGGNVVRTFVSPIPVLITSTALLLGAALHLVRERQKLNAALQDEQRRTLAQLEQEVAQRTSELVVARDVAEQANSAKSVFLAKVSHELRTPMHAVLGYVDLVLREQMTLSVLHKVQAARTAGRQLVGRINELLDYARLEREQLTLAPTSTAIHALAAQVSERARLLAAERGNQFDLVLDPALPPWVWVDASRLEQVLMVLLDNAVRYTRGGRISLHIGLAPAQQQALGNAQEKAQEEGSCTLYFEVHDTGRGIAPHALASIFQAFERGGSVDSEGLGLGLPIAQQLLGLMGTQLHVTSQPGVGSRFAFTVAVQPADESQTTQVPDALIVTGYTGRTRQVLVLDDHPTNRRYLEELLGDLGFETRLFATVPAAVAHLQAAARQETTGPDLCIVDQRLEGGETGWDFVAALRHDQGSSPVPSTTATFCDCPVLMLSATEARPPTGWALAHGIDRQLLKPVEQPLLLRTVGELLNLVWTASPKVNLATPLKDLEKFGAELSVPEAWQALSDVARSGGLSALDDWMRAYPQLATANPVLERLVQAMDFVEIAAYAVRQK